MWTLIITAWMAGNSSRAVAVTSVPGFTSKEACMNAAAWYHPDTIDYRAYCVPMQTATAEQKK